MNLKDLIRALRPKMIARPVANALTSTGEQLSTSYQQTNSDTKEESLYEHHESIDGVIDGKETDGRVFIVASVYVEDPEDNADNLDWCPIIRNEGESTWEYPLLKTGEAPNMRTISAVGSGGHYDTCVGWMATTAGFNNTNFEIGVRSESGNSDTKIYLTEATVVEAYYVPQS